MEGWLIAVISVAGFFGVIIAIIVIIKIVVRAGIGRCTSDTSLVGKTTIVTGSNTGIGYETALDFARRGARVILACRNEEKAEEARRKIVSETKNQNVIVKLIDMSSFKSVRDFAEDCYNTEDRLDILVNNAGAADYRNDLTIDGNLFLMQVNYFSPSLLTILLCDLLKGTDGPSRIVNLASMAANLPNTTIDLNNLNSNPGGFKLYSRTKLCNVLFTIELAKKLKGSEITTYSVHPGAIKSEFLRNYTGCEKFIFTSMANLFFLNTEEGAQTSIYTSVEKGIEKYSGEYFAACKKQSMIGKAKKPGLAEGLWEKTMPILQLKPEEIPFY